MARVALNNASISQTTASDHIRYRRWEYQYTTPTYCNKWDEEDNCIGWGGGNDVYDWEYYYTSATVSGDVNASVTNVKVEGISPIVQGDSTTENDSYSIPSGEYVSGAHNNVSGNVTGGNSNNVYINGKSVSVLGSSVSTHANTSSSINSGASSTVYIGG